MQELLSWLSGVASVVSLVGAIVAYLLLHVFKQTVQTARMENKSSSQDVEIERLRAEILMLQNSIMELPKGEESQSVESRVFGERLSKLEQEIRSLRELLFDNPEATVTIPLIKKDVESLARENEALRRELDRQSSSTRWFLGILITLSVGLLGLVVNIFLK